MNLIKESTTPSAHEEPDHHHGSIHRKLRLANFDGSFLPSARPERTPVVPYYKNREYLFGGWLDSSIWRSAVIEAMGIACLIYTAGQISATLASYEITQVGGYVGILSAVLLSLYIYATAPVSGGHINPMITFSSVLVGRCPLSRGVLYMLAHLAGASIAGGLLTGVWGRSKSLSLRGGGCYYDMSQISTGQVFLNEFFASFILLFLAYGVALDPRQPMVYGQRLGPLLVGLSLGLTSFATSGIAPGYPGPQLNPAVCFAFGVARRDLSGQWIWWFASAAASVLLVVMFAIAPLPQGLKDSTDAITAEQEVRQTVV
ncbi:major intrinsic protein domain-containing protein [Hirsutella rhossiliensis]